MRRRRSIRLPGYDYAQPNAYFVTICSYQKEHLFGEVVAGEMRMNEIGRIVESVWDELSIHYPYIENDVFVVMPNHVHGIIFLTDAPVGATPCGCPSNIGRAQGPAPTERRLSLPDIVHRFKSMTTTKHRLFQNTYFHSNDIVPRLWQRNYYERVIRCERELDNVRNYIRENPAKWDEDPENMFVKNA